MGIFRFDASGQIVAFEEKPTAARLEEIGQSMPRGAIMGGPSADKPFVASMGVYVFSRDVLLELLASDGATDFGREIIPAALGQHRVQSHLFRGYWADVGTIASFYDANLMLTNVDTPFRFYDPHRPIFTHARFLPGSRLVDCTVRNAIIADGCFIDRSHIEASVVGIRTFVQPGATVRRSVLLGADFYEADSAAPPRRDGVRLGIGRDAVLDKVIVDKNARIGDGAKLVNERGVQDVDGNGYFIRDGVIVVPKDGVIAAGTVV
jgi:glucose-1-phosphate adenylyltransferase